MFFVCFFLIIIKSPSLIISRQFFFVCFVFVDGVKCPASHAFINLALSHLFVNFIKTNKHTVDISIW